jgi:hypothetical protein
MRMEPDAKPKGSPADLAFMEAMEGIGVKFVDVTPDGSRPVPMECGKKNTLHGYPYEPCTCPAPVQTPEGEPWWYEWLQDDPKFCEEACIVENDIPALLSAARRRFAQEAIEEKV